MYEALRGYARFFNRRNAYAVVIDYAGFRLHYKATAALLLLASSLVTMSQFFGSPIHCLANDSIPEGKGKIHNWETLLV